MPAMLLGLAAKGGLAAGKRIASKVKGRKKAKAKVPGRRRPRRIVFSENQWRFVQSLMRMGGRGAPSFPSRRRRRRPAF